ncbi:Lpg1974 family pore-forming outer membrane protein [Romeriopsis navalis]|nr:Lpg1974 family pore-forming outer membrane protein [Romeriopsis navalis]
MTSGLAETAPIEPTLTVAELSATPNNNQLAQSETPANPFLEQLQRLEQKQQALEAEIQSLKQQLANTAAAKSVIPANPDSVTATRTAPSPQNVTFSAEAVFLRPSTSNLMDFAVIDTGEALATAGEIAKVRYDELTTPRWRLAYRAPNSNWDLSASHLGFKTSGTAGAVRPTNGFLFSTFSHPFQNDSGDVAVARSNLKYQTTDIEIGQTFNLNDRFSLRAFGGLRSSSFNQAMAVNFDGRDFTNAVLETSSSFTGFGPRLGAELNWNLARDLSIFGRGAGSLLLGRRDLSTQETDNNGQDTIVDITDDRDAQIVPGLEFTLGLAWKPMISKSTNLDLRMGYEYQYWFNAGEAIRFTDAATPGSLANTQNDLSLQGLFLQFGISTNF